MDGRIARERGRCLRETRSSWWAANKAFLKGRNTYQQIETKTGVPWWFVGLCHYRESHFDFNTYLGNGQALGKITTIVPKGRGPFLGANAFVDGAVDGDSGFAADLTIALRQTLDYEDGHGRMK